MKQHCQPFGNLQSIRNFILIDVMLFWGAVFIALYHPPRTIDLEVLTERMSFLYDAGQDEDLQLLRSVPVSWAGFRNFTMSQLFIKSAIWPAFGNYGDCNTSVRIGSGEILCTPSDSNQAQLLFRHSRIKISDLRVSGTGEIDLLPRSSESQNQILMGIRGLQTQLRMEFLSDTIRVQLRDYAVSAKSGKKAIKIAQDFDGDVEVKVPSEGKMARLDAGPGESLVYYDMQEFLPEHDDLLQIPVPTSRVTFHDRSLGTYREFSLTPAKCVSLGIGEQQKNGFRDRTIFIHKQDLRNFQITGVRATQPGKLHVSLRGKSGIFRAGVDANLVNQVPTALANREGKIALLGLVLIGVSNFYFTFRRKPRS